MLTRASPPAGRRGGESMRSLILLAAGLACLVLVATSRTADAADDAATGKAVSAIEKHGGKVWRDEATEGKPVVRVDLGEMAATDADLAMLKGLPGLAELSLAGCAKISD